MNFVLVSNIFPPHVRGGYELGCRAIAEKLVAAGHIVRVVTSAVVGHLNKSADVSRIPVSRIFEPVFEYEDQANARFCDSERWQRRRQQAFGGILGSNAQALCRYLQEHSPDVVWIFNPLGIGPVGILEAALTCRAKCIIHLMDHIDDVIATYQQDAVIEARWRRLKQNVSAISCSRKIQISNQKLGPYRSHRVIYNGISFANVPCSPPSESRSGPFRFVYFGQLDEIKGVLQIVRAAAELRRARPDLLFFIDLIGRGSASFRLELVRETDARGLNHAIRLVEFMERNALLSALTTYDAAILLLSDLEPFAYALIEAAAAGLPVIATQGAGAFEAFPADYPLAVKDRTDSAAVARAMSDIIDNNDPRELGLALRAHLAARCDIDSVIMPAYLRVIRGCPAGSGAFNLEGLLASHTTTAMARMLP